MEDLPLDLSLNILKRLPVTSLLSFRLVSKACYAMTTDPLFAWKWNCLIIDPLSPDDYGEHVDRHPIHVIENGEVVRTIEEPNIEGPIRVNSEPVLSANGLLCLLYYGAWKLNRHGYSVCLCNPLMGEPNLMPDPDMPIFPDKWTECTFGFGYNASTRAYKVIIITSSYGCLTDGRYGYHLQAAKVITVGKKGCGQWSEIGKPFLRPLHSSDVVVGDALHWICQEGEKDGDRTDVIHNWFSEEGHEDAYAILSFDLSEEKFHKVSNPDCQIDPDNSNLSVLGGCLALTCYSTDWDENRFHIWTMKEYGVKESWTKELVIRSTKFPKSFVIIGMLRPRYRLKDDKILIVDERGELFSYDPKEELFEASVHYFDFSHNGGTLLPVGILDNQSSKVIIYRE